MSPAFLAICFASGAASLVLELVWVRLLGLSLGSTSLAIATTLGVFMGGLALGSRLAGPLADRLKRPLLGYGVCELVIGVYALGAPAMIAALPRMLTPFGEGYTGLALARFLGAVLVLLVPTTLMGATMPMLLRHVVPVHAEGRAASRLGALYAANTSGAVFGTFLAGFVLLPEVGVRTTNAIAAAIDLVVFLIVLLAGRRLVRRPALETDLPEIADPAPAPIALPSLARKVVLVSILCSGATAMVLEVLWSRALAIVLGSSVYSFSLILLTFLGGLALGSALCARTLARSARPLVALCVVHATAAAFTLVSYLLCDKLPALFLELLKGSSAGADAVLRDQLWLAVALLLPPTIPMGAILPLTIRALSPAGARVATDVGRIYSVNTLGAIAGSFTAGFYVLPHIGLERGLLACVAIGLVVAIALALVAPDLRRRGLLAGGLALGGALAIALSPSWALARFSYGLFRVSMARDIIEGGGKWPMPELLYYKDGIGTTVSVERWNKTIAIKNNGKVDASNDSDMPTQIAVGLLPLLLSGNPAPDVAIIGYGSGVTAGAALAYPARSVDVVELEPAIVEAATRFFDPYNGKPLSDPRTHLHADDGRNFLLRAGKPYDVIISQPSNPWITGVSNLFTREYFEIIRSRLKPGGMFCQWAQLYELHPIRIKSILASVRSVFPNAYVFAAEDLSSDVILIASDHPFKIDRRTIARALENARTRTEAARAGIASAEDVLSYLLLAPDELEAFTAGAPQNTDDNMLIEFGAPRDLLGHDRTTHMLAKIYGEHWPYGRLDHVTEGFGTGPEAAATLGRLASSQIAHGRLREAARALDRATANGGSPSATHARRILGLLHGADEPELPVLAPPRLPESLPTARKEELTRDYAAVEQHVTRKHWKEAKRLLDEWPDAIADASGPDLALLYGYIAYKAGDTDDAIDALKPLAAKVDCRVDVHYWLGRAYYDQGLYPKGAAEVERWVK